MKLVVGLGNPGREYVGTRHNVGWEVVDQVATRLGWVTGGPGAFETFAKAKFDGLTLDGVVHRHSGGAGEKLMLLKPQTYMNVSGRSVQAAMSFFGIEAADVLIVLDDLALPCGKIRVRGGGSPGGHNGLKSIELSLGTDKYPRLRIGIDMPPPRVPQRDYVLGKFTPDQRPMVDQALARAAGAVVTWVDKGLNPTMNQFNVESKDEG